MSARRKRTESSNRPVRDFLTSTARGRERHRAAPAKHARTTCGRVRVPRPAGNCAGRPQAVSMGGLCLTEEEERGRTAAAALESASCRAWLSFGSGSRIEGVRRPPGPARRRPRSSGTGSRPATSAGRRAGPGGWALPAGPCRGGRCSSSSSSASSFSARPGPRAQVRAAWRSERRGVEGSGREGRCERGGAFPG